MESLRVDTRGPSNNWYRAPHVEKEEDVDLEARWVLQCLMRGVSGMGTLSKISIKKICDWCSYTDSSGKHHPYGKDWVNSKIQALAQAGKITIQKGERGKCTQYTINTTRNFEQVPDAFYYLPIEPAEKGYLVYMLQHNVNKYRKSHDIPYDKDVAECDYDEIELSNTSHENSGKLKKIENHLSSLGLIDIVQTTKRHEEIGTPVVSRQLQLQKIQTFAAMIQMNTDQGKRVDNIYDELDELKTEIQDKFVTKEDISNLIKKAVQEALGK